MKPGATTLPAASMVRLRGAAVEIADGGDFAVADADVAGVPGRAGAVDDVAVGDDEVEGWRLGERERGEQQACEEDENANCGSNVIWMFLFICLYPQGLKP